MIVNYFIKKVDKRWIWLEFNLCHKYSDTYFLAINYSAININSPEKRLVALVCFFCSCLNNTWNIHVLRGPNSVFFLVFLAFNTINNWGDLLEKIYYPRFDLLEMCNNKNGETNFIEQTNHTCILFSMFTR